jgi:viroplasmin and RNaseH domain-containing protein
MQNTKTRKNKVLLKLVIYYTIKVFNCILAKGRETMASKYYAVKVGRKKGIFNSWDECRKSIEGFSNAVYKSFSSYDDAYKFVFDEYARLTDKEPEVFAYIDGSYDDSQKVFSYAGIIFNNGEKVSFSNVSNKKELVELRNVAGELSAAMFVMDYAKRNNIKVITIYYDYVGIEMWATDKWKANLKFTQEYSRYSKEIMKDIKIVFEKVKAHSGVKYNEEVDKLAKMALQKTISYEDYKISNNISTAIINEENIFSNIKGSKSLCKVNIFTGEYIISPDGLLVIIKNKWKKKMRNLKEIKDIKSYYNVVKKQFVVMVTTEKDENIITVEGSEFNGKK